jgi:hypothetical protein
VDTALNIAAMKPKDLKRWTKREDIAAINPPTGMLSRSSFKRSAAASVCKTST